MHVSIAKNIECTCTLQAHGLKAFVACLRVKGYLYMCLVVHTNGKLQAVCL